MDTLHEMGIQRWRLRADVAVDSDRQLLPISDNADPHNGDTSSPISIVDGAADPSTVSDIVSEPAVVTDMVTESSELTNIAEETDVSQGSPSAEVEIVTPTISWSGLAAALTDNPSCVSCAQSNPILGEGNIEADFMLVVDAPSARDIQEQSLVAGRQGQLLDAILAAIGLDRDAIYLSSVFKCPPSVDLALSAACGQMVHDQISLVKPRVLLTMGEFASQSLLRANEALAQLQAKEHRYPNSIKSHDCTVICTHSLAEIIDKPMLKRQVWEDLKLYLNGV